MATHSSILAWRIPWREETGGLHSPWDLALWDLAPLVTKVTTEQLSHFAGAPKPRSKTMRSQLTR